MSESDNQTAKWIRGTELGILVLSGTELCIVYRPHPNGHFALFQSGRLVERWTTLVFAKRQAERRQRELEEIGVA